MNFSFVSHFTTHSYVMVYKIYVKHPAGKAGLPGVYFFISIHAALPRLQKKVCAAHSGHCLSKSGTHGLCHPAVPGQDADKYTCSVVDPGRNSL